MKTVFVLLGLSLALVAQTFTVYTEHLPPFNYLENNQVVGSSTQLLEKLLQERGHKIAQAKINLTSWARGYHEVLYTPHTILYSMARTPEREHLFKWVGPINTLSIGLIAKKSSHVAISKPECLHNYTIAVMHDTAAEKLLLERGMKAEKLERFSNVTSQLKKLHEGRVDAMAFGIEAMYTMLEKEGINPLEYETVYILSKSELYFAFHKETDNAIIEELNATLKLMGY